jgi:hypothetical protein
LIGALRDRISPLAVCNIFIPCRFTRTIPTTAVKNVTPIVLSAPIELPILMKTAISIAGIDKTNSRIYKAIILNFHE